MDDLDAPRVVPGAADAILRTLERLGLRWDGEVLHQSDRHEAYATALESLAATGRTYRCDCSRRDASGPYAGTCRGRSDVAGPHAIRFALRTELDALVFQDRWQGPQCAPATALGDPVVWRRDGLAAYQLAVVIDDAFQGVTDVVRGADLLESTFWQVELQDALGLQRPGYAHTPLVTEPDGSKLAKSRRSLALDSFDPADCLRVALGLLGQPLAPVRETRNVEEILRYARNVWRVGRLPGTRATDLPSRA